jgi:hypothetical protein
MFAADNWTIPFVRKKLEPVAGAEPAVAKALALASGGRDYFEMAIHAGAALSSAEKVRVAAAMDAAQTAVEAVLRRVARPVLGEDAQTLLREIWTHLWSAIDAAISLDARQKLAHLPVR